MAWALWLAAPVLTTLVVAVVTWRRGRPERIPDSDEAIRAHQAYLDALTTRARGTTRVGAADLGENADA